MSWTERHRRAERLSACVLLALFTWVSAKGLTPKPLLLLPKIPRTRASVSPLFLTVPGFSPQKERELKVEVSVGEAKILPVWDLQKVVVGNPKFADVKPISDHELLILGKAEGTTNLILWEGATRTTFLLRVVGQKEPTPQAGEVKLVVLPIGHRWLRDYKVDMMGNITWTFKKAAEKVEALQKSLELILPASSFYISSALNTVTVKGTEEEVARVKAFLKQWDKEKKQVLLETQILEVFDKDLKNIGVSNTLQNSRGQFVNTEGEGVLTFDSLGAFSEQYLVKIKALEEKNRARLLANPRLVQVVGEEQFGHIFLGDQVPVRTATITATGNSIEQVQYFNVGVLLNFVPMAVDKDGTIRLSIVVQATTIKGTNAGLPIFTGRTANSEVEVKDGETFVLGGLIKEEDVESIKKIPLLGDLPILGNLFKSRNKSKEKTEVIAVITPHILD